MAPFSARPPVVFTDLPVSNKHQESGSGIRSSRSLTGFTYPAAKPTNTRHKTGSHTVRTARTTSDHTKTREAATPKQTHVAPTRMHPVSTLATVNSSKPSASASTASTIPSVPSEAPVSDAARPAAIDNTSATIGFAFLAVISCFAVFAWVYFVGIPKYRKYKAKCAARKKAQATQQQWWNWLKASRTKPWQASWSRNSEATEVQHVSSVSSAVLDHNVGTMPLRSGAATVDSSTRPDSEASGSQHRQTRSFDTFHGDIGRQHLRPDLPVDSDHSPGVSPIVENASVVHLGSARARDVVVRAPVRPRSMTVSIISGGGQDGGGFEEVDLGDGK